MIEIEKTFLVKKLPSDLSKYKSVQIKQGYLSPSPSPLRIRQKDSYFEITKKIPLKEGDYSSVEEINIPLTEFEFQKLWNLTDRHLEKTRYLIPLTDGLTGELDIFQNDLNGLYFIEIEFSSKEQMDSFVSPDWFGKDVTQEEFSANSYLAGKNFSQIKEFLE